MVIVFHRRVQIVDSDCIYIMKQGRAVESGTHEELHDQRDTYRKIFDASARSLSIGELTRVMVDNGGEVADAAE